MPFKVEKRKFRASRKASRIRKPLILPKKKTPPSEKCILKMFAQSPQALTLFRRYQHVGATEARKISKFQEEAFRILNHPSSCERRNFV
jgi:hypothetical protein